MKEEHAHFKLKVASTPATENIITPVKMIDTTISLIELSVSMRIFYSFFVISFSHVKAMGRAVY